MTWITSVALPYLGHALLASGEQLCILLGPVLLLAAAMHFVSAAIRNRAGRLLGTTAHIWLTAPGTVIHELGHALFCLLFGHQIREISLFSPRKDGVLGYVKHSWNRKNLYHCAGNFFIGTGPIWLGATLIVLFAFALLGPALLAPLQTLHLPEAENLTGSGLRHFGVGLWQVLVNLGEGVVTARLHTEWRFYLFLYILFCIGSHVTLSTSDLSGAGAGLLVIVTVLFLFNLATLWLGSFVLDACYRIASGGLLLTVFLLLALLLNLGIATVLAFFALFRG